MLGISSTSLDWTMRSPPFTSVKCVCVGDPGVGKTSIVSKQCVDIFPPEQKVFDNVILAMEVDGRYVSMDIWDTSGEDGDARQRCRAYASAGVFLVVFDLCAPKSLINARNIWMEELRENVQDQKTPILLVGAKMDLREPEDDDEAMVTTKKGEEAAELMECKAYVECSASTREGLRQVFETAARVAIKRNTEIRLRQKMEKSKLCAIA